MPDPTRTNVANGTSAVASTTATFGFTATAGRLLVLVVGSDDYKTGDPAGYTLSAGMSQQTFLGHYLWWKIASGGETSVEYVIGSAAVSCWSVLEYDNIDGTPYDTSMGTFIQSNGTTMTTSALTPTTGSRLVLASIGGSTGTDDFTGGLTTWLNSYTEQAESFTTGSVTDDIEGVAHLIMDGDGVTTTSSGATYPRNAEARTGLIISFKVATAGGGSQILMGQACL